MSFPKEDDLVSPPPLSSAAAGGGGQTSSGDEVSTISYDNYFSRNTHNPPPPPPPPAAHSIDHLPPPPPATWLLPADFHDGVENDDVDTTLRLCPPGTFIPPKVYNPTPLRWFRPHPHGGAAPPAAAAAAPTIKKPRNSNKREKGKGIRQDADGADYKKKRKIIWAAAGGGGGGGQKKKKPRLDEAETSAAAANRVSGDENKKKTGLDYDAEPSAAAANKGSAGDEKAAEEEYEDQMGRMFRVVESCGGSKPEFLYRKKMEAADVRKDQNRVFLTRAERVMEFLREEEAAVVYAAGKGLRIVGVDGGGNVYRNLVMKKWSSVKMIILNSDWNRVVNANHAHKNDVLEIWGYRDQNGKSCFAFIFRR